MLRFTDRSENFRVSVVRTACLGYVAFAGAVVVESLAGVDPLAVTAAPVAGTVLARLGTLVLLRAGLAGIRALVINGPGARAAHGQPGS